MREPAISDIIGVYNCKSSRKFIRSVESIINQTFQDWELIICDDGSTFAPEKVDFYRNSPFMHPTMMIRRGAIDAVRGYRVSKETRRCEDYDMFMRMYAKGYKGANLQDELYQYYMFYNDPKMHRSMKYRIDEAKVRYIGFKNMGILKGGFPYIVKRIIVD